MTVRSAQLAAGLTSGTAAVTLFTVPAGHVYIVKSILLENPGAVAEPTPRLLTNSMDGTNRVIHVFPSIPSNGSTDWLTWFILDAGDTLQIQMPTSSAGRWIVSGADLLV